jgi:hypothetical protein
MLDLISNSRVTLKQTVQGGSAILRCFAVARPLFDSRFGSNTVVSARRSFGQNRKMKEQKTAKRQTY